MSDNFYKILGISENASETEIKKAYRTLSLKYHPDKNGGNAEAINNFHKISEAYETLGDPQKKMQYDMIKDGNGNFVRMNSMNNMHNMDNHMEDIMSALFGGMPFGMPGGFGVPNGTKIHFFNGNPMGFNRAMQMPTPIIKKVTININDVLTGTTIPVEIERWIVENNNKVFECETLYAEIPKGIDDGEIIILREKGNVINETVKGDVKIHVEIKNETDFKRSGLDLLLEKKISLKDSLCGCSFEIKHINGKTYTLNNNSGNIIVPDYRKIIPGLGIERGTHKGNLILIFKVEYPQTLNEKQISSLKEIL
jgi:DnaJ-class molecular chaperone